jgi:Glycine-zipper domain
MEIRLGLNATRRFVILSSIVWLLIFVLASVRSSAQEPYVYPAKGQSQAQQDKDRYECHTWATQQTGFDPSNPQSSNASASGQYQPSQPHVVKGAGRGAALGAVGGAIAGDAGKGAAAGAAMGGLAGGFRRRDERRQQANAQASDTSAAASNQRTSYNRAMAACLQGRGYTVN